MGSHNKEMNLILYHSVLALALEGAVNECVKQALTDHITQHSLFQSLADRPQHINSLSVCGGNCVVCVGVCVFSWK